MKCRICGAELKKEGDICSKCYKKYQEEEELKKDVKEIFKIKRKYLPAYEITKYIELYVVFFLVIISFVAAKNFLNAFFCLVLLILIVAVLLLFYKKISLATRAVFYEKKVVYKFKFLFIKNEKMIKYSDIKDITIFQTRRQKKFDLGDICFYAKGNIPGVSFFKGFQIKNVADVEKTVNKIKEIIFTIHGS